MKKIYKKKFFEVKRGNLLILFMFGGNGYLWLRWYVDGGVWIFVVSSWWEFLIGEGLFMWWLVRCLLKRRLNRCFLDIICEFFIYDGLEKENEVVIVIIVVCEERYF